MLVSTLAFSGRHVPNPCVYCMFHRKTTFFLHKIRFLGIFFSGPFLDLPLGVVLDAFGCPLGSLGASWEALGPSFGSPWEIPWELFGVLWGPLGTLLGNFGELWGAFVCAWGRRQRP